MPFVGGVYQPDQRSPMERLYGFREKEEELRKLREQQAMEAQRKDILAQFYTPEQAAVAGVQPQFNGTGMMRPVEAKEGKPASFDVQGAINRLYSVGDLEGAEKLENNQYKSALGNRASSGGAEKWYGNSKTIKGSDGKLYNQILSSAGNVKLVPVDGDLTGELKQMDIGGKKVWINSYTGQPVTEFTVTPNAYQSWQMDDEAQAGQAAAVESAKGAAKARTEREQEKEEKAEKAGEAVTELNSMVTSLQALPPTVAGMKWEGLKSYFTGGDPKIQEALGNIDRISGRMLEFANKLPGAATDADRVLFMSSAGVMNDPSATPARKIAAAQSAIGAYNRLIAKYGNGAQPPSQAPRKPGITQAGRPTGAPKPGTVKNGYIFMGGDPASQKSWRKL